MSLTSPLLTGAAICVVVFYVFKFFLDQREDNPPVGVVLAVLALGACWGIGLLAQRFTI